MRKKVLTVSIAVVVLIVAFFIFATNMPVALSSSGALPKFSIDDKISRAELVAIGEVRTTLPSKWMGPNGTDPKNASPEDVVRAR